MLSAMAVELETPVRVTLSVDAADAVFLASLNLAVVNEPLQFAVQIADSALFVDAPGAVVGHANADLSSFDSLQSDDRADLLTIRLTNDSGQIQISGTLAAASGSTVDRSDSSSNADHDSRLLTLQATLHRLLEPGGNSSGSEPPRFVLSLSNSGPTLSELPRTLTSLPNINAINGLAGRAASSQTESAASNAAGSVSSDTAGDARWRQATIETRQAVQLLPRGFLLLANPAAERRGNTNAVLSGKSAGTSIVEEISLVRLVELFSTLTSPAQREARESNAASPQPFRAGEIHQPGVQAATPEAVIETETFTGTLTASLPAVALQQTVVSLAGMLEDLLLTLNSLLHAVGIVVVSESVGSPSPVAPTIAPVFPGDSDPRQFAPGLQMVQSVLIENPDDGQFQLEPFSRRGNSIQSLTLEFAPRHGQILVRDLRRGILVFEAAPGFDGADSAAWQATLDDGSSMQGTLVFLVDRTSIQAIDSRASLLNSRSSSASSAHDTALSSDVSLGDRDAAFSSDDLLNLLQR